MTFASPAAFFLFIPLLAALWSVYRRRVRRGSIYSTLKWLPRPAGWRIRMATALPAVAAAGLVLFITALARPRALLARIPRTSNAIAIQMVVDVSGSMRALDLAPTDSAGNITAPSTRLDIVKETFKRFIAMRPHDLIGLISFGGYTATRAPLTLDHDALLHFLKEVEIPSPADEAGGLVEREELMTAIGDALAAACARLREAETASRIIVLLSDGESNAGILEPLQAAQIAKKLGIRVYTIGVGRSGHAPFLNHNNRISYSYIGFDEQELRAIAETTDGYYFNATNEDGLIEALEHIDKLETTEIEDVTYERHNERFTEFLWPGMALLLFATVMNMKISKRLF